MQDRLALNPLLGPVLGPPRRSSGHSRWLLAVAAAFTVVQLIVVVPGSGLGWDEAVYVSQVGGNAPPAFFSAPRARGISYLVAPVASWTASTTAIRVYLALLSGSAFYVCLWIWRKVLTTAVLACAGALFATLWITLYYGPEVMPNLWCAFGALAAVGCVLRAIGRAGDRAAVVGAGVAVAVVGVMRPADGVWLALPLAASTLLVPGRRRPAVFAAIVGGLVIGAAPWVIEAYLHYGGLSARLHRASEIQGGLGWNVAVDDQVRTLAGRSLCRPCNVPWRYPLTAAWWFALPVVVVGGIVAAFRAHRGSAALLATVTAASMAVPYLFFIDYAAPRFLLPAYALLALPAGECGVFLLSGVRLAPRPVTAAVLALVLAGHLSIQLGVLARMTAVNRSMRAHYTAVAAGLHRLGVRPPCMVTGYMAVPIAYYAGCSSRQPSGHDASITPDGIRAAQRDMPVAVIVADSHVPPPRYARSWRPVSLPDERGRPAYRVYLPPGSAGSVTSKDATRRLPTPPEKRSLGVTGVRTISREHSCTHRSPGAAQNAGQTLLLKVDEATARATTSMFCWTDPPS
ncbi:hypothetical protein OG210_28860 [Streptomyces sp. NBC_00466]|uniref:hypothetical protein n=1 Tax=Streptomyces sp. NBC_00466 TaxID=2903655 RepID=UPI0030E0D79D